MRRVLVTNDDGFDFPGLIALVDALRGKYDVTVVAPKVQQSWMGKAITAYRDLRVESIGENDGIPFYSVDGTPADCVQAALYHVLKELPDLVVSGVNDGLNAGTGFVWSSGTVGAALEASLSGVPAIAVSLDSPYPRKKKPTLKEFSFSAHIGARTVDAYFKKGFPAGVDALSVNVPYNAGEKTPVSVTKMAHHPYMSIFKSAKEGSGKKLSRKPGALDEVGGWALNSDLHHLRVKKEITVTPLRLDLTADADISGFARNLRISSGKGR
ncbi:5'-nucleotidase SurE1 [uncultured archaeon]|nr:5'-nucleotidase SurE1 [uncultured archaeon]